MRQPNDDLHPRTATANERDERAPPDARRDPPSTTDDDEPHLCRGID